MHQDHRLIIAEYILKNIAPDGIARRSTHHIATFFLVGEEITAETEEIVKRMVEEGHTVGLHTYSHDYEFIYRSVDNFLSDYEKLYRRLFEVTGQKTSIFRFPGGSTNRYGKAVISTLKLSEDKLPLASFSSPPLFISGAYNSGYRVTYSGSLDTSIFFSSLRSTSISFSNRLSTMYSELVVQSGEEENML